MKYRWTILAMLLLTGACRETATESAVPPRADFSGEIQARRTELDSGPPPATTSIVATYWALPPGPIYFYPRGATPVTRNSPIELALQGIDNLGAIVPINSVTWTVSAVEGEISAMQLVTFGGGSTATLYGLRGGTEQLLRACPAGLSTGCAERNFRYSSADRLTLSLSGSLTVSGPMRQLTPSVFDKWNNNINFAYQNTIPIYASSNVSVVAVNSSGGLTALRCGSATITASIVDQGVTASGSLPVTAGGRCVTSVEVAFSETPTSFFQVDSVRAASISVRDGDGSSWPEKVSVATWNSSNPSVFSVSPTGVLTARGAGTAALSATVDGVTGTTQVTVRPAISVGIAGATTVGKNSTCTFTSSVSGGTAPYSYSWSFDGAWWSSAPSADVYVDIPNGRLVLNVVDALGNRGVGLRSVAYDETLSGCY